MKKSKSKLINIKILIYGEKEKVSKCGSSPRLG